MTALIYMPVKQATHKFVFFLNFLLPQNIEAQSMCVFAKNFFAPLSFIANAASLSICGPQKLCKTAAQEKICMKVINLY